MDPATSARPAQPTSKQLSLTAGKALAQRVVVVTSTAALLVAVLGCGASNTLVATSPPVPTSTPPTASTHEVARTATLIGTPSTVVATCPPGEIALSGGWNIPPTGARVFAAKVTGNGWAVSVLPLQGSQVAIMVTAYVECLQGATGVAVTQRATTVGIPPSVPSHTLDTAGGFIGTCQQNEGLVGFGFDFGASGADWLELEASVPSNVLHAITWSFKVWNYDTVAHDVTFDLECATTTAQGATMYPAQQGTVLYAGMSGSALAICPAGTMVAGGGFHYTLPGVRTSFIGNEYSHHATPTGWQSSLYAFTSYGLVATAPEAIAVCLSLT